MGSIRIFPILILLAVTQIGVNQATASSRIEEGLAFPDLTLPAIADGRPRSIADFRGRKVVLHVFASW